MAQIISLSLIKGGVGKSTTTLNLAFNLFQNGKKVLVIDIDPQANLTKALQVNPEKQEYSIVEVLLNPKRGVGDAIVKTTAGLDLVSSRMNLVQAEVELNDKMYREALLAIALEDIKKQYDYILIDTPPSFNVLSKNALVAADFVIIPTQVEQDSYEAIEQTFRSIDIVKEQANEELKIAGILCTMVDKRNNLHILIEEKVRKKYPELVFTTVIPRNIKVSEARTLMQPINKYDPFSSGAEAYSNFTSEFLHKYGK